MILPFQFSYRYFPPFIIVMSFLMVISFVYTGISPNIHLNMSIQQDAEVCRNFSAARVYRVICALHNPAPERL